MPLVELEAYLSGVYSLFLVAILKVFHYLSHLTLIWHFYYNVQLCFCFSFFRHVQVNNEGAIKFYEKFGFEIVEEKKNYYKRIEPADAYVLQKSFRKTGEVQIKKEKEKN